jgi:hypothetical protein
MRIQAVADKLEALMSGPDNSFNLSDEEQELLLEILEEHHRRLLLEISHTDHQHFKVVLRKKAQVLESVLGRIAVNA